MTSSLLDDALAKQVLFDLFSRLPTATLVYSCRLACDEWQCIIEIDMRALWDKRARTLQNAASFAEPGATQMLLRTLSSSCRDNEAIESLRHVPPMALCTALVKQAYKRWHVERVLRSWRKEFCEQSTAHKKYWRAQQAKQVNSLTADPDVRVLALANEMSAQLERVCNELDERILEDDNDVHVEARLQYLANEKGATTEKD